MEIEGQLYLEEFLESSGNKYRVYEETLQARLSKYMDLFTKEIIVEQITESELAEMIYLLKELGYNAQERTPILRKVLQKNGQYDTRNK